VLIVLGERGTTVRGRQGMPTSVSTARRRRRDGAAGYTFWIETPWAASQALTFRQASGSRRSHACTLRSSITSFVN
jgi:hypothetical protein